MHTHRAKAARLAVHYSVADLLRFMDTSVLVLTQWLFPKTSEYDILFKVVSRRAYFLPAYNNSILLYQYLHCMCVA